MLFKTADPQQNGVAAEAVLRRELGWNQPVPFRAHGGPPPKDAVSVLAHMASAVQNGQAPYEQAIIFEATYPFSWAMTIQVARTAGHFVVGARSVFATMLRGAVSTTMTFGARGAAGWANGDPAFLAQLNQDAQLVQSLKSNLRTQMKVANRQLSLGHYVWLVPEKDGVLFLYGTMPAVDWKGSAAFGAQSFLWQATRIQEHLDWVARSRPSG